MFNSKTYCLFTILTILLKFCTNLTTALPDGSFSDESLPGESSENETTYDDENFEGYIVGGKYARIQDFPHSAFLMISCYKMEYRDFTCGASILNQLILLTAAHCFEDCEMGTKVLVSVGDRKKTRGKFYNVGKFANHGEYNGRIMKNDIAMAILTKPLVFSSSVKRVILSPNGIYEEPALVAGWGITNVIIFSFFS